MTTPFSNPFNLPELANPLATTQAGVVTAGVNAAGHMFISGLYGAGTAPALAAGAGAGTAPSVGSQLGFDLSGSFVVTIGSTPGAGALATVTFGTALSAAPASVLVTCWDQTSAAVLGCGPTSISKTGFTVSSAASTAAHTVLVNYFVTLQQA
jgi:hypothetical protein